MCLYTWIDISMCVLNADNVGIHLIFSVCGVELLVVVFYALAFEERVTFTALLLRGINC